MGSIVEWFRVKPFVYVCTCVHVRYCTCEHGVADVDWSGMKIKSALLMEMHTGRIKIMF